LAGSDERLSGGALNAALANELGKLIADFTGRERPDRNRRVRTFLSGTDEDGGCAIEAFVLEPEPPAAADEASD
jgi:hypothetical protein